MLVGGPLDGHRLVLDQVEGNVFYTPVVEPLPQYVGYDMLEPAKLTVQIGQYDLRQHHSAAQWDPYWVGIWQGAR